MADKIIGTGVDGTTNPILEENDPLWDLLITEEDESPEATYQDGDVDEEVDEFGDKLLVVLEPGSEPEAEIDLEDVDQVYGIAFPSAMLPIKATSGIWESEPILDVDGNEETALVRVWLYPPEGRD